MSSEQFDFAGAEYRWSPALTLRYFQAELNDIYSQDYAGAIHYLPVGDGRVKTDLRVFSSTENGSAKAGAVDNRNYGAMFTYLRAGHGFGVGYMFQAGDTAMPYIGGGEPAVLSDGAMSSDFVNPRERTWIARYDYDFAALGVPGLTGMLRYMRGSNIDLPRLGGTDLKESSRDVELAYVVQSIVASGSPWRVVQVRFMP